MTKFQFNGDWEFRLKLDAFKGYVNSAESYGTQLPENSEPYVTIKIQNEFSEDADPSPEQLAAIDYLIENQEKIKNSLLEKVA